MRKRERALMWESGSWRGIQANNYYCIKREFGRGWVGRAGRRCGGGLGGQSMGFEIRNKNWHDILVVSAASYGMEISIAGFHPSNDDHGGVPSTQVVGAPSGPTFITCQLPNLHNDRSVGTSLCLLFSSLRFASIDIGITSNDEIGIEQGDL